MADLFGVPLKGLSSSSFKTDVGKLSNVQTPPKVTTGKSFDVHSQPVIQGQSLMTVEENVVGRKKFDIKNEMPNNDVNLILIKEKGNTFDAKNLEMRKGDLQNCNHSPAKVAPQKEIKQVYANDGNQNHVPDTSCEVPNDKTVATVEDKKKWRSKIPVPFKSKMKSNMDAKFQLLLVQQILTSLNHPLSSSFPNA